MQVRFVEFKFNKPVLLMASPVYTCWRKQYMVEETIYGRGNNTWQRKQYMVEEAIHARGNNTWQRKQYMVEETIHGIGNNT